MEAVYKSGGASSRKATAETPLVLDRPSIVSLKIAPESVLKFERRGDDLVLDVPVTFSEAALGAEVEIPTPEGRISLKVPSGSRDGRTLRVKGRGAPRLKGGGRGDLLARVRVDVPKKLTKKEREALQAFDAASRANPRERLFS